jgi:putative thiamine transport system substrate-binding protein
MIRRRHFALLAAASPFTVCARADAWADIEARARGQTVHFAAWAGSDRINAYLRWAADEIRQRHGVMLEHVKVNETAEVVQRIRAEATAGRTADGATDLVWINGENFLRMKRERLLFGPWSEALPAYAAVDVQGKPTTRIDFSEPVDGMEAPWGMAQLTFFADRARVPDPPSSVAALRAWAQRHPGRFTYPRPPQFLGTTFLKQVLIESAASRRPFDAPFDRAAFDAVTAPLWRELDALHPHLWKRGRQFPDSPAAMRQMLADGELSIAFTFNPNEPANEIAAKRLPASVVAYQHAGGTIGNTHFVAIPFNARSKEGAQVVANFLLGPEAQARKANIEHWGDPTVLALDKLTPAERARFAAGPAAGRVERGAAALPEPHASWVEPLEREWTRRYGQGG